MDYSFHGNLQSGNWYLFSMIDKSSKDVVFILRFDQNKFLDIIFVDLYKTNFITCRVQKTRTQQKTSSFPT